MPDQSVNNRRIVRNTLFLYFRMFLVMGITLFTSRIVLSTLGIEDFGIYNVVGGIVVMSGIMNGAMSVSAQRYLTFEIGRGDHVRLKQVFNMCVLIFALFSFITLILAETAGLWFLNNKMVIPPGRLPAANRIFQFSVFASVASLMVIPYNALIIARERMNVYAYIGILEVLLKLGVVYLLLIIPADRLSVYGCLMFLSQVVVTGVYVSYCRKRFPESRYRFYWERPLFKELVSYSGWNLFGSAASLVKGQGLNVLLNLFFNPSVNAARGIAYQVNSAITQFFTNFYTAVRPQITKYYAQGNQEGDEQTRFQEFQILFLSDHAGVHAGYYRNPLPHKPLVGTVARICSAVHPACRGHFCRRCNFRSVDDGSSCHRAHPAVSVIGWDNDPAQHSRFLCFPAIRNFAFGRVPCVPGNFSTLPFYALVDCAQVDGFPCPQLHHTSTGHFHIGMRSILNCPVSGISMDGRKHFQCSGSLSALPCFECCYHL